jgi:hypothetical protein
VTRLNLVDDDWFELGPGLALRLFGDRATLDHFRREYRGRATHPPARIEVEVLFQRGSGPAQATVRGGHKTVSWTVALSHPDASPLGARIALRGRPRGFARSLVQGYFVEPLLGVASARRDCVLLPAAALDQGGRALVLLGRSRSGKSTLMARALAADQRVLGDDQVLIDDSGRCWPFPRRMRVYPDLRETAPTAYRRLSAARRGALAGRRAAQRLSRGYIAPSLSLALPELGGRVPGGPVPVGRMVVIIRLEALSRIESSPLESGEVVAAAREMLDEQRTHLRRAGEDWSGALEAAGQREEATLRATIANITVEQLAVPARWSATRAIQALSKRLGIAP